MSWTDQLQGDPLPWLLEEESPGARYLALRDVVGLPEADAELISARREAHRSGPISRVLARMKPEGYWVKPGPGYSPKYGSSVWSLILLAQLGADLRVDPRLQRACTYILDQMAKGGQFSAISSGHPSGTIDCLQGNLCGALTSMGCEDPRLDKAFVWMARSVTGEGLGPADGPEPHYEGYKCGPNFACSVNNRLPCGWGAVKVMLAFSMLPPAKRTPLIRRAIRQGVDFLFSVPPEGAAYPTRKGDKPSREWWKFGFPVYYVTDLLQLAEALTGLGCGGDPRLAGVLEIIRSKQDAQGRWPLESELRASMDWMDFGAKKQPNKWVTLRALKVLRAVN